ncbi:MAG: carbon starvation protein A [Christensenellales bacterium]
MNGLTIMIIALVALAVAYLVYGRYLANKWGIDPKAKTPAYELRDGVDYEPADTHVVFGHQFASIAGAGPINGPIQAAVFGWVPVLLWVLFGSIFFGAVQDFSAMYASVKNKGRTIGYIIEEYIGKTGKKLFLLFCWLFCILVVAAFADVVAGTFNGFKVVEGVTQTIAYNGSVATTSMIFIVEAVALGFLLKYSKLNKWVNTAIAIVLLVVAVIIGLQAPMYVAGSTWHLLIFIYIFIASIVPVWALLQPRDYLNSYLLVFMIVAAAVGIIVVNPSIKAPAFTGFYHEKMGSMFPILFVTVACGAVSGFHSLVSSGTSSKQIKNEKDMLPVSFGGMLMEGLLAVIALVAGASFAAGQAAELGYTTPPQIFAGGVAGFLEQLGMPHDLVFTLINLSVSAFALTSLDSVARIGRLSFQELFLDASIKDEDMGPVRKVLTNKYFATVITLAIGYILAKVGYRTIWPLFGSANQLLSALSLMACAVFLKKTNRQGIMLVIPMAIMMLITFSALGLKINDFIVKLGNGTFNAALDGLQMVFAILLTILGVIVAAQGIRKLTGKAEAKAN